jgi:hypothetical protein
VRRTNNRPADPASRPPMRDWNDLLRLAVFKFLATRWLRPSLQREI